MTTIPLNEHPRPDFHRGRAEGSDWLNLNGHWDFAFDPDDSGDPAYDRQILVPFGWESHLAWGTEDQAGNENWYSKEGFLDPASVTNENYKEAPRQTVGWYRRSFEVPAAWAGQRVILHVGAVDYAYKIWVNGTLAAEGESGYTPVDVDLTDLLIGGEDTIAGSENTLVIRAHDPQDHQFQPAGKQFAWYTRTGGIWQTVWLEPRAEQHITGLKVYTTPRLKQAKIVVAVAGVTDGTRMVQVSCDGQDVVGWVQDGSATVTLRFTEPKLWSPEEPNLYDYTVQLTDIAGVAALDEVNSYFGIREVSIQPLGAEGPKYVHLNGKPIYLRGALDQSFNPWGVYTFPSDEAIREDIVISKQGGFNFLRIHIKLEDPRFLYWADKLGILLMCDMPNYGYDSFSDLANARWERVFRAAVERDFNHPSIFSWCLFNETWAFGFEKLKTATDRQEWIWDMFALAKRLDTTRLIEDNSACNYDHVVTDINSWHFYINDYNEAKEHIAHVVRETYPGSHFNYCPAFRQRDEPLMNSEYGGIGAGMGDKDVSWCFKYLTSELRKYPEICGYVYTELQDIEWEHNGFYDYDRRPKEFGYDPALMQGEVFLGLDNPPAITVKPGETVELRPFVSNFGEPKPLALILEVWSTNSLIQTEGPVYAEQFEFPLGFDRGEVNHLAPLTFAVPGGAGVCEVVAHLVDEEDNEVAYNFMMIEVREEASPAVEGRADGTTVLRKLAGDCEAAGWAGEVERGEVEGEAHFIGGMGAGSFTYRFAVPEGVDGAKLRSLRLLLEASSKRDGAPQTSEDKWPSDIAITVNGIAVDARTLADQPADSRGALSHLHGLWGRYGELVAVEVTGDALAQIAAAAGGELAVTVSVPASAGHVGGLNVYSSRAGRFPADVTLMLA